MSPELVGSGIGEAPLPAASSGQHRRWGGRRGSGWRSKGSNALLCAALVAAPALGVALSGQVSPELLNPATLKRGGTLAGVPSTSRGEMLLKILTKFPWLLKQLKKKKLGSFPPKGHFRCLPESGCLALPGIGVTLGNWQSFPPPRLLLLRPRFASTCMSLWGRGRWGHLARPGGSRGSRVKVKQVSPQAPETGGAPFPARHPRAPTLGIPCGPTGQTPGAAPRCATHRHTQ